MRKPARFIEMHADGTATLNYPGWPPQHYRSSGAALNRRRLIEIGKITRINARNELKMRPKEERFIRENWGFLTKREWENGLSGRTYGSVKAYAKRNKIRASTNSVRRQARTDIPPARRGGRDRDAVWSDAEIETLASNPRLIAAALLAPERTLKACQQKAVRLGFKEPPRVPWEPHELAILYVEERAIAKGKLTPKRSAMAVNQMARRLGLALPVTGQAWDATEMALLRNIIRCVDALKNKHGRSGRSIDVRATKERRAQAFVAEATARVQAACAGLDPAVRRDVEGEVLVAVLSKAIKFEGITAEIRAARTRIYGPRHFSLDAPVGDGSMTWLDTIADDRQHF